MPDKEGKYGVNKGRWEGLTIDIRVEGDPLAESQRFCLSLECVQSGIHHL